MLLRNVPFTFTLFLLLASLLGCRNVEHATVNQESSLNTPSPMSSALKQTSPNSMDNLRESLANKVMSASSTKRVEIARGSCEFDNGSLSIGLYRKADNSDWCLSGLTEQPIAWQWSPEFSRFAYALQDKQHPTGTLSGRMGYAEVENLNWYLMDSDGANLRRFDAPDPGYFKFSPDGNYADFTTYNDYGRSEHEVFELNTFQLYCRYSTSTLWYRDGEPTCGAIPLSNGDTWNFIKEGNIRACERFHRSQHGEGETCLINLRKELCTGPGASSYRSCDEYPESTLIEWSSTNDAYPVESGYPIHQATPTSSYP